MKNYEDIIKKDLQRFFTIPKEELIILNRKHVFNLLLPLIFTATITFCLTFGLIYLLFQFSNSWSVFISLFGIIITFALFFTGKNITEWNFHWYIITSRKIIEICYVPLTTFYVNDILLDQVKCTEIDIRADGILNEILDMGDINITFDRPTKQEGFYLRNIRSARKLGMFLTDYLQQQGRSEHNTETQKKLTWFNNTPFHKWRFSEEIFPRTSSS